jgi:hypothetical protein
MVELGRASATPVHLEPSGETRVHGRFLERGATAVAV